MNNLLVLAVLPAALLLYYIYKLDPVEKEPLKLLGLLLGLGVVSVIPAIIMEMGFSGMVLENWRGGELSYLIVDNFLGVALIEEFCKYFFMFVCTWKNKVFNFVFDGIVYAVFVSLGFAIAENIFYVYEYGFGTGVLRAFTAIPGHCVFAVFMGYFYGEAKYASAQNNSGMAALLLICAFIVPVFCHGLYDFLATIDGPIYLILFFLVLAGMVALGLVILKTASKQQKCIYPWRVVPNAKSFQQQPYMQQPYQQQYPQQLYQQPVQQQYSQQPVQQQWQPQPQVPQQQYQHPAQQQYPQPVQQYPQQSVPQQAAQQQYPQQPAQQQYQQQPQTPQQQYQQPVQPQYQQQPFAQQPMPQQPYQQQYQQSAQQQYPQKPIPQELVQQQQHPQRPQ